MRAIEWDGNKISQSGLYSGVPIEVYHGDLCDGPSVSKSVVHTLFSESPAHAFQDSYLNPDREPYEESATLIQGRGAHHLLLGESDFNASFAIQPAKIEDPKEGLVSWNSNRIVCKEWLAHVRGQGLTVLKPEMVTSIRGMSKSLAAHPMIQSGILNGLVEHTMVYRDRETGLWVKIRPDVIPTDDLDVGDLKTAADVRDEACDRAIGDFGYAMQGAMIRTGMREVLGRDMGSFSLVFVEKTPPYCVNVKTVTDIDLDLGEEQARASLNMFAKCLEKGKWPGPGGYTTDAAYAEITPWRRREIEFRVQRLKEQVGWL